MPRNLDKCTKFQLATTTILKLLTTGYDHSNPDTNLAVRLADERSSQGMGEPPGT